MPFTLYTTPACQDAYDDVVSQRIIAASKRKPGHFGVCGLVTYDDLGPEGRRRTPSFWSRRKKFRWATGSDSAPIGTIEERKLFNKLMTIHASEPPAQSRGQNCSIAGMRKLTMSTCLGKLLSIWYGITLMCGLRLMLRSWLCVKAVGG